MGIFGQGSKQHTTAFYSFSIWDETLTAPLNDYTTVTLNRGPQSITVERGFRSDFGLDISGNPVVAEAGFGPGKWSLRGAWGVGKDGVKQSGLTADWQQGLVTEGVGKRLELERLFELYADINKARVAAKRPLAKLVFSALHGGPSEFKNEVWWILPMGMPTLERSISRPLDSNYSLSFWALQDVRSFLSLNDYMNGLSLHSLVDIIKGIADSIKSVLQTIRLAGNAFYQSITNVIQSVQGLINTAKGAISMAKVDITLAASTLKSAAFMISSVTRAIHDTNNLPALAKQELGAAFRDMRIAIGKSLITLNTNGTLNPHGVPTPHAPVPVIPGRDLRQIAASVLGDASKWSDIASMNGLVYPFVSWPSSGSTSTSSGLIPGTVAMPGSVLSVPRDDAQVQPMDPAGLDLDPAPSAARPTYLVGGVSNIVNALTRRLNTPKGYLPHHPNYGSMFKSLIGAPLSLDTVISIRQEVSRVLLSDSRVTKVTGVTVNADPTTGVIIVNATAQTILGPASFAVTGN